MKKIILYGRRSWRRETYDPDAIFQLDRYHIYQELQLNQAGSKNLLKKSETVKEKTYHMWVYLVKIAVTMEYFNGRN